MKKKVNRLRVAIDGPAASGKNTLAKQIAKKYKLLHLDSGKLYRYFALQVHQSKDQNVNYTKLNQALKKLKLMQRVIIELQCHFMSFRKFWINHLKLKTLIM